MPKVDKADAVEQMLSEMRCVPPTDAQRVISLQRQIDTLYAAFVVMERERDEAIKALRLAEPRTAPAPSAEPEQCICAAVLFTNGRIARGHRHSDCFITASGWPVEKRGHVQGFITSRNRFVDREEGARLQNAAGLTSAHHGGPITNILFSEDLYLGTNDRASLSSSPEADQEPTP